MTCQLSILFLGDLISCMDLSSCRSIIGCWKAQWLEDWAMLASRYRDCGYVVGALFVKSMIVPRGSSSIYNIPEHETSDRVSTCKCKSRPNVIIVALGPTSSSPVIPRHPRPQSNVCQASQSGVESLLSSSL